MDLIVEIKGLLSRDEKILINRYLRSSYGDKEGDLESKLIKVPFTDKYSGRNAKKHPVFKSGPAKGLPMTNKDGMSRVLKYKGQNIFFEKDGTYVYPQDVVNFLNRDFDDEYKPLERHNGGFALVKDKPYDAKLKAVLAHAAKQTVKSHWVQETPLSTIKKLGK